MAVFDFDKTLTRRDTLVPWLVALCGAGAVHRAILIATAAMVRPSHKKTKPEDRRTRFKRRLLGALLPGASVAAAQHAALNTRFSWHRRGLAALARHRQDGDEILIATGACDVFIAPILQKTFGLEAYLATRLKIENGILTGALDDVNCVRQDKAALIKTWLRAHGPFDRIYGYGNAPSDLPFLSLTDHPHLVAGASIKSLGGVAPR
ncbi:MAG: HAD-IB family phosphatase [Pseudomonadota bacterium]